MTAQDYFPMHEGVLGRNTEAEMRQLYLHVAELFADEFLTRRKHLEDYITRG
mgnify:CR=1 FL=1